MRSGIDSSIALSELGRHTDCTSVYSPLSCQLSVVPKGFSVRGVLRQLIPSALLIPVKRHATRTGPCCTHPRATVYGFLTLRILRAWRWGILPAAVAIALAVAGCGNSDYGNRLPITGTVTVNGQPLDIKATIYFDPVDGGQGIGSMGGIADSKFSIPVESGPTPGLTYNVKVITSPGIPAEGTPLDQIRQAETYVKQVEIPQSTDQPIDLKIDFDAQQTN